MTIKKSFGFWKFKFNINIADNAVIIVIKKG